MSSQPISAESQNLESKQVAAGEFNAWYLVQIGIHGQVGRLGISSGQTLRRSNRVVCRTVRGLEVGKILGPCSIPNDRRIEAEGRVLRKMTPEDELLWQHLQKLSQDSLDSCEHWLEGIDGAAKLLEVEPLLDGRTIYFHFLSEPAQEVQLKLNELASVYEQKVRESKFAQLLEHGCGPGCGTKDAKNGCGTTGGCAVCKIASACSSSREH